ncbi:hypothetical protein [Streptococcus jiangjianxini]|uniref:hypothetical protein n=1 Tax=Streptococcus jiangjianxini TaxID=3161189 RepID=UPI0032EDFF77
MGTGESFTDSIIREMTEESGLTIFSTTLWYQRLVERWQAMLFIFTKPIHSKKN